MAAFRESNIIEDSSDSDIEEQFTRKIGYRNLVIHDSSEENLSNISIDNTSDIVAESCDESTSDIQKISDSMHNSSDVVPESCDESTSDIKNSSDNDSCNESQSSSKVKRSVKSGSSQDSCDETQSSSKVKCSIKSDSSQDSCDETQSEVMNTSNIESSVKRGRESVKEHSEFFGKENVGVDNEVIVVSPQGPQDTFGKGSYLGDHRDKLNCQNVSDSLVVISSEESDPEDTKRILPKHSVSPLNQDKKTTDIRTFLVAKELNSLSIKSDPDEGEIRRILRNDIDSLEKALSKLKSTMLNIDMSKLPDNGLKLKLKYQETHSLLKQKIKEFSELPPPGESEVATEKKGNNIPSVVERLPVGFGAKALQTQIREKTLTEEALQALHGSLNSCPGESVMAEEPVGLKPSVSLMPHQKHAIAWMLWRETQKPKAGILADDMGLGKTLTAISLVLKDMEEQVRKNESFNDGHKVEQDDDDDDDEDDDSNGYPKGGTLIVCPATLMHQWEDEIKKYCKKGVLEVEIHHGYNREENARSLARNDMVITTYSIVRTSAYKGSKDEKMSRKRRGVLHRVKWKRIVLDEAHAVRNHKSQQSIAVCLLMANRRWALTGTPIHNKELDLYALLKFLKVSPFDDYNVWKRWVDNKNAAGIKRLNAVINTIMLRRTKSILQGEGLERQLPEKVMSEIEVQLADSEYDVYTKVLLFSKTLFAQFLQQRADKEEIMLGGTCFKPSLAKNPLIGEDPLKNHPELGKMFQKMVQMRNIKTHQILVLLLRLRQICCHPGLIKAMIDQDTKEIGGLEDANGEDIDLISQMNQMSIKDSTGEECEEEEDDDDDENVVLSIKNPIFNVNRISSKIKAVLSVIDDKIVNSSDKGIVVSQWASMLDIIHTHLRENCIKCEKLTGSVPVKDRMEIVRRFNNESNPVKILLLSLTAGGVGLNLTGANHLLLVDLHWNPQLESQAFDRIYRVGQKKDVYIYKFFCKETIEERIKALQLKKLSLAEDVLKGSMKRSANKLTIDDLKSIFSM